MNKLKQNLFLSFLMSAVFIFNACIDAPNEFVAPVWDVNVNFPVTIRNYSLRDAIKNDSSFVVHYDDPSAMGLIYYVNTKSIQSTKVRNTLQIDSFSASVSQSLNSLKLNPIAPVEIHMQAEDWLPGLSSGSNQIIPPYQAPINSDFSSADNFELIKFESGSMQFRVINNLPVEIELRGIQIKNKADGTLIAERSFTNSSEWLTVMPNDTGEIYFDLASKTILNSFSFYSEIYTPGSNGQIVQIPNGPALDIYAGIVDGFVIERAVAPIPVQDPVITNNTVVFDNSVQPNKIQRAVLDAGSFDITISNHFDLDVILQLTIDALKTVSGSSYTQNVHLARKETGVHITESSLAGWMVDNGVEVTNSLAYSYIMTAQNSSTPREIFKDDKITIDFNFSQLAIRSFKGQIKPVDINIDPSKVSIDIGDIGTNFGFDEINLSNPNIILKLKTSSNIQLMLNAGINISNGIQSNILNLNNVLVKPVIENFIELKDYGLEEVINSFTNQIPDSYSISGNTTINPNYLVGEVSKDDSISGSVNFELPLDIGISGGLIKDTFAVNFGSVRKSDVAKFNYGEVTMELTNEIPVELAIVGVLIDTLGNEILAIPPRPLKPSNKDTIFVDAPQLDLKGNTVSAGYRKQSIELFGDEVIKFLNNPSIAVEIRLVTPPSNSAIPIKFEVDNKINFKIYAKASYRMDI